MVEESVKVQFFVESMVFYILAAALQVSEPLGQVSDQQMLHEALGTLVKVSGELDLAFQDFLIDLHGVLGVEGVDS